MNKMQGLWVSLKENIKCGSNINDIICLQSKQITRQMQVHASVKEDKRNDSMACKPNCERISPPRTFTEVEVADLSRKVIEKILGDALISSTRNFVRIRRVLKVKNSHTVVEKFEKFRDMVKQKANKAEQKHPRSLVDGNELLCFYVTTITCLSRPSVLVAAPCERPDCNLCRIIDSGFDTEHTRRFGIQLSVNSEALRECIAAMSKSKKAKRAVIICRTIAGRARCFKDEISADAYDSVLRGGFYPNSKHLILNNFNAVLCCFVVILD